MCTIHTRPGVPLRSECCCPPLSIPSPWLLSLVHNLIFPLDAQVVLSTDRQTLNNEMWLLASAEVNQNTSGSLIDIEQEPLLTKIQIPKLTAVREMYIVRNNAVCDDGDQRNVWHFFWLCCSSLCGFMNRGKLSHNWRDGNMHPPPPPHPSPCPFSLSGLLSMTQLRELDVPELVAVYDRIVIKDNPALGAGEFVLPASAMGNVTGVCTA